MSKLLKSHEILRNSFGLSPEELQAFVHNLIVKGLPLQPELREALKEAYCEFFEQSEFIVNLRFLIESTVNNSIAEYQERLAMFKWLGQTEYDSALTLRAMLSSSQADFRKLFLDYIRNEANPKTLREYLAYDFCHYLQIEPKGSLKTLLPLIESKLRNQTVLSVETNEEKHSDTFDTFVGQPLMSPYQHRRT